MIEFLMMALMLIIVISTAIISLALPILLLALIWDLLEKD